MPQVPGVAGRGRIPGGSNCSGRHRRRVTTSPSKSSSLACSLVPSGEGPGRAVGCGGSVTTKQQCTRSIEGHVRIGR